jgi:hypothetical protein
MDRGGVTRVPRSLNCLPLIQRLAGTPRARSSPLMRLRHDVRWVNASLSASDRRYRAVLLPSDRGPGVAVITEAWLNLSGSLPSRNFARDGERRVESLSQCHIARISSQPRSHLARDVGISDARRRIRKAERAAGSW